MSRSRRAAGVRRRGRLAARLAVVVPLGMLGAYALAGPASALPKCSQTATTVTCTFSETGAQSFTVPSGVHSITVTADGAEGGDFGFPGLGGLGGEAQAAFTVSPGDVVEVIVGGQGTTSGGGFNGGGAGGAAGPGVSGINEPGFAGAGGGGATDVRTGTCAATLSCGLAARVLVAGGGGGGAVGSLQGGGGGNPSGGMGSFNPVGLGGGGGGGGGGSQTAGGAGGYAFGGGAGSAGGSPTQDAGGAGGDGGPGHLQPPVLDGGDGGGGGGGGYWGGGGGGGGDQENLGGAGGGGSSFGPTGATFTNATNSGNGKVTITYSDADLAIAQPANITTAATSPGGAAVTYSLPTVTDPDDTSPPAESCGPKSGSVFPVGTTTVTCTANDSDDSPSTVSVKFTVTVTDTDLVIAKLANMTVDATGPSGAVVTFAVPAPDPDDGGPVPASCTPKSGSVFPIGGPTTVTCTHTDTDDTPSTVTATFTVTVKGAAAQLADLAQAVAGTGAGPVLGRVVAVARQYLAANQPVLVCVTLNVFIQEVRMYTPGLVPAGTAAQLIAAARQIQAVLGCSGGGYPFGP